MWYSVAMPRIVLINPNTNTSTTQMMVGIAGLGLPSGFTVSGLTVTEGDALIANEAGLAVATAAVAALFDAQVTEADGYIISAFSDPGLTTARERSRVPVVGIAEAGMAEAARDGRRFGIATTTPDLRTAVHRSAVAYGHGDQFVGVRITEGDPSVLHADRDRLVEALAGAVERCIDDGADAVVIGGGPLARIARVLAPRFAVPLIEPIPAATRMLVARLS